jgi:hypothetical protein
MRERELLFQREEATSSLARTMTMMSTTTTLKLSLIRMMRRHGCQRVC